MTTRRDRRRTVKWMEFIKVQTTAPLVVTRLLGLLEGCSQCPGLLEAKVFHNASVDDCSLCLRWDTDRPEPLGSSIGVFFSTSLKQYGLVDHSVWIEQEEQGEKRA